MVCAGKHLLLVDDNDLTRHLLRLMLNEQGYTVAGAANGQEALDWLRRLPLPDCIILDLEMPVMDGWEFRHLQEQDPHLAAIPVVIVSSEASAERDAAVLGAVGFLPKPVDLEALFDLLRSHC
jgi:CheY-like chemotaxis protein